MCDSWTTRFGDSLLTTPTTDEVSAMLMATAVVDGIVYLVPPADSDSSILGEALITASNSLAYALIVRPGLTPQVEVVELPDVATGAGTPLGDYLAAFGAALDTHDPRCRHREGFCGTPLGWAWSDALDERGAWAYARLVGPLVKHTQHWSLEHTPHLALVPLGEFAAIPYAAAWVADSAVPGRRRYAIHDLVLTYTASVRLLGDVARRPCQPLTERVVLVADPTGEFPYVRATTTALADPFYPDAEVCGPRTAPNGHAFTECILTALPGQGRLGGIPAPTVHPRHDQTEGAPADGWLPLSRILEDARGRPPDSAGGLITTNACLTDSTRAHYDDSVTLATALLAAGAIGTRWPIDDDTTATLTYYLHYHLAHGHPPAQALRLAQLDLLPAHGRGCIRTSPHSWLVHPVSWGGYVYHGT